MWLLLTFAFIIVAAILHMEWVKFRLRKLPGPNTLPVLGNLYQFGRDLKKVLNDWGDAFGDRFRVIMGPFKIIVISNSEDMEVVMNNVHTKTKSIYYKVVQDWIGESLGIFDKDHTVHRKQLSPPFRTNILETYLPIFAKNIEILADKMEQCTKRESTNLEELIPMCVLDGAFEIFFGKFYNFQSDEESPYPVHLTRYLRSLFEMFFQPYLLFSDYIYNMSTIGKNIKESLKIMRGVIDKEIERKKQEIKENPSILDDLDEDGEDNNNASKKQRCILDWLLKIPNWDDTLISHNVHVFLFAGYDTTTSTVIFTLYNIAKYPHIQEKMVEELDSIYQGSDREVRYEDLKHMNYIERVLKETMRLYPPAPFIGRHCAKDVKLKDGVILPENSEVLINIYRLHRNRTDWTDPDKFDPDRFLPENCAKRHNYAFAPFSLGPRICIGNRYAMIQMKAFMAILLRRFQFVDVKHELNIIFEIIIRATNGVQVGIRKR